MSRYASQKRPPDAAPPIPEPDWLDLDRLEMVAVQRDADGKFVDRALDIVRKFVSDRGLVLYGGLGLDYSLRIKGGQIYDDGVRPDFDFLSSRNVDDAYDLVEILHEAGFQHVEALRARHVQTMRVRVDFVVVADVSYMPESVLAAVPRHLYVGKEGVPVNVLHPHWQYMDQHQAFCFPFRDPPMEPVFQRFKKDLHRHNLLYEKYPFDYQPDGAKDLPARKIPVVSHDTCAVHGAAALAMLEGCLDVAKGNQSTIKIEAFSGVGSGVLSDRVRDMTAQFDGPFTIAATGNPIDVLNAIGYEETTRYRALMDIAPEIIVGKRKNGNNPEYPDEVLIYSHPCSLLAATQYKEGIWMVSPQYMLMHFLLGYHASKNGMKIAVTRLEQSPEQFLRKYLLCRRAVDEGASLLDEMSKGDVGVKINLTPFSLTSNVVGRIDSNVGEAQLMTAAVDADVVGVNPCNSTVSSNLPSLSEVKGLSPSSVKYRAGNRRPQFDYAQFSYFRQDGREEE